MESNYLPTEPANTQRSYQLSFWGKGSEYFGIIIINWILTAITLGLYYPLAKAKRLQYVYGSTALENDPFAFHGTGNEMFKGFIKALLILLGIYGLFFLLSIYGYVILALLVLFGGLGILAPLALHGTYRYRMSRTSWRGIRFGYRGDRNELLQLSLKGFFLTIITFGIYGPWWIISLRNYIFSHIRYGDVEFKYEASGTEFFILNLKGYFLTIITLGIYMFWWEKDMFAFYVNHLYLEKDQRQIRFTSTATGGDFFKLIVPSFLIIIFTLGLGYAWVEMRIMQFIVSHIDMEGNIDLNSVLQTEANYTDATGEDVSDWLDTDLMI